MNLYRIFQNKNDNYDTYDSAIVAAESEEDAKDIHPSGTNSSWQNEDVYKHYGSWTEKEYVQVELIGIASDNIERGVILASFNAG